MTNTQVIGDLTSDRSRRHPSTKCFDPAPAAISNNTSTGDREGLFLISGSSTIRFDDQRNSAGSGEDGGGIYLNSSMISGTLRPLTTITNSTISGNPRTGGGRGIDFATVTSRIGTFT